ncbi:N-acetyltransferase [Rhodobacteraceae bacterium RKSG542]|uniref:GNAT family N-acetyltransferase n=1 Tax=Pseudovibrio flavus TaxID=2529854 RepID=UPI0012BB5D11|nr:GNAT family N-acetyltransferase [Pseudovibrio flavus]MTI17758.1 N-acetyltransferase [Pseudovibrio flavus]
MTRHEFPILKTERLTLRPFNDGDLLRLCEYLADYDIAKMLMVVPHPYSAKDAQSWIDFNKTADLEDIVCWVLDDGSGLIGVISGSKLKEETSLGYWLGKPHWGKGFVSEAAFAVMRYFFETRDEPIFRAGAFEENGTSNHILRKLGFEEVARDTVRSVARGDEAVSHICYELTKERFLQAIPTPA